MLEFVVVWLLAGYVGGIARDRGHKPTGYKWMTVGLWVGGEVIGAFVGAAVSRNFVVIYLCALAGAACGALLAILVVQSLVDRAPAILFWYPTHPVPGGGMLAWVSPDPSQPPVATLPEGLPLVVETRGHDWWLVRAENGWRGWVDGQALQRRPGLLDR